MTNSNDALRAASKTYADYGERKAKEGGVEINKEWVLKVLAGDADGTHGVQIALLALQSATPSPVAGGDLREAGTVQYGDPPTDRHFLARAVTSGFDHQSREWGPTGRAWVEARWDGQAVIVCDGEGLSNEQKVEIVAWAELPQERILAALNQPAAPVEAVGQGEAK